VSVSSKTFAIFGIALAACIVDTAPEGLRATPTGPGARVVYDVTRRPLPEIPLPNDTATFADPTSRTGRRVNVSLVAPTSMERVARTSLGELEGWGTYAPITVAFAKSELGDASLPALDLDDVRHRMPRGNAEFGDDPFYVINLKTGVPMVLDMDSGALRMTLRDPSLYWANDYGAKESNLVFETREEGAGLTQADYRPELDTDFDGVIDHPNTYGNEGIHGYDNLLTWYERESDTLVLRPRLALDEATEYAVVLTDRLHGSDARPIRSPFEYIHHPQQRDGAARVRDIINDAGRRNYYGDIAGTGLDHVAHVWTFTTQPITEDYRILRDGLYGKGPFARFKDEFPPKVTVLPAAGLSRADEEQPPGWQNDPKCTAPGKKPLLFNMGDPQVRNDFGKLIAAVAGGAPRETQDLLDDFSYVSHVLIGEFDSPYLIGDPKNEGGDDHFHVNIRTGEGEVKRDKVHFWMVVPKETEQHKQPFPISLVGHGYGGNSENVMSLGGGIARQGIATISIDMPHHGLTLKPGEQALVRSALLGLCYAPFGDAVFGGRAEDVNKDGQQESGWWWWTSHLFHVRDNVRQGILDSMQATRILASFDGKALSDQDFNGDGKPDLAGDFDGNGVPDVGGPITATGGSLGGIITQILGAVDHQVTAAAPIVGGGGLSDVGLRSYGVAESVLQQTVSPIVVALPVAERANTKDKKVTTCADGERTVRFIVNDGRDSIEVEVACLRPDELDQGMTVVVTNVATKEVRCGGTWAEGRFRIPIPTSVDDRLDIQVYPRAHAVKSYGTCELVPDAPIGRRIQTFERAAPAFKPTASEKSCEAEEGCTQFLDRFFTVGSPLVAVQEGLGLRRQTPLFRRFFGLGQMVLDAIDPMAFAPYYMFKPLTRPDGSVVGPRPILNVPSVGDNFVSISTEIAFGRAAGIVPFLPPDFGDRFPEYREYVTPAKLYDDLGRKTPDQVLIDGYVTEGIARLGRTPAGPACTINQITHPDCPAPKPFAPDTCQNALYDADWNSEGALPFDQQHPVNPLRLTRRIDVRATDTPSLDRSWEPRLIGAPFSETGYTPGPPLMGQMHIYTTPAGTHGPEGSACSVWNGQRYLMGVITRFIATGGRDLLYISDPKNHRCAQDNSCAFLK
jgi:hypothetical protein